MRVFVVHINDKKFKLKADANDAVELAGVVAAK